MITVCPNCGKVIKTLPPFDNTERIYIRCEEGCKEEGKMGAILGKTTGEAIFAMKVHQIAKKHNCIATLDFNTQTIQMDGELEDTILALDEIKEHFGGEDV